MAATSDLTASECGLGSEVGKETTMGDGRNSKSDGTKEERASLLEEGDASPGRTSLHSEITATAPEAKRPKKTSTEPTQPGEQKPRKSAE